MPKAMNRRIAKAYVRPAYPLVFGGADHPRNFQSMFHGYHAAVVGQFESENS